MVTVSSMWLSGRETGWAVVLVLEPLIDRPPTDVGPPPGTLVVDDDGRPFRTSGNNGRPAYEFPLGGQKWSKSAGG